MISLKRQFFHHRHPIAAWAILRVITSAAGWYAASFSRIGTTVQVPGYEPPTFSGLGRFLFGPWLRADALWYLKISRQGYSASDGTLAFFPVYPAVVSFLRPLFGGNEVFAALFLSSLATLVGMILLYRFASGVLGERFGRCAVWGIALLPTAFFLVAPYAEGLFLMLAAWALLASSRGRWIEAFFVGAMAAACRPFGFLLVIPILCLSWGKIAKSRSIVSALGPVVGMASWIAFAANVTGDLLGGFRVQDRWQREATFPWLTLWDGLRSWMTYRGTEYGPYFFMDLAAAVFALMLIVVVLVVIQQRRIAIGLSVYGAGVILLPLSSVFTGRPLLSMPRFLLAMFPLLVVFGAVPVVARRALGVVGAVGLFVLTVAFVAARPIF